MSGARRPLRVVMVCPYDVSRPGGVRNQAFGLSHALRVSGHEVLTIAPGPDGSWAEPWRAARDHLPRMDGDEGALIAGRSIRVRANGSVAPVCVSPWAVRRALRATREFGADVVHLHEPLAPILGYGYLATRRWPLVATFHRSGEIARSTLLSPVVRRVYRRLDVRVAVSEAAAETAKGFAGMTSPDGPRGSGGFEVLPNGIDLDALEAPVRAEGALRAGHGAPVVLFLGRHEARKGLGVLLEAFDILVGIEGGLDPDPDAAPEKGPGERRAVLWVAGDGPQTAELRARHPPSSRVQWLGVLSDADVARCLAGAAVLVAPSLGGESFGLVLLEAMATQTAVVCSDIPGYRDAAGGHATLVTPGDPAALARALGQVLATAPDSDALHGAGEYAKSRSMEELAVRYEALYEVARDRHDRHLLGGRGPRGIGSSARRRLS